MSRSVLLGLAVLLLSSMAGEPTSALAQEGFPTQEEIEAARTAPLFLSSAMLELSLEADFHTIRREDRKDEDSEERPATMRWQNPDGSAETQEIQVQTRGNFRLARRNCDFPPLRLNVKKEAVEGTLFEGQDKLKLVVACKLGQDYWEQYVILEYLTYRTLNTLTDLSFRVRPARVTYVDTSGEDDTFTKFAFIIEDNSDMAKRVGGLKMDWPGGQIDPRLLETDNAILVDVFQYMIGNTDWSGAEGHNMELLRTASGAYTTVPYDFDFSGIVNARYATPDPSLSIRNVRERLFRGFCMDVVNREPEQYEAIYDLFREKKEEIYGLFRSQEGLDEGRLEDALEYWDDFYETLDDEGRIRNRMMRSCRRF